MSIEEADVSRLKEESKNLQKQQLLQYSQAIISATDDLLAFVDTDYIYRSVNLAYCKKFKKSMDEIIGHSVVELHGEDVFYGSLKASLDISLVDGKSTLTEFTRVAPNGALHWIRGQHNPYFDERGNVTGVVVAAMDITDLKETQIALAKSQTRLQFMYDETPSMLFTINQQMLITSVNSFVEAELGFKKSELLGRGFDSLFKEEDKAALTDNIAACFSDPSNIHSWELQKINSKGQIIWVKETARMVEEQLFIVSEDFSEKHAISQKLSYQASHDYLTDLLNRQEFERLLQQLLDSNKPADDCEHVLCYLDLDQFKIINDSCGHLAGDLLLKDISDLLKGKIRRCDILARIGGDEFGLILESCPLPKALDIANAIIKKIANYQFNWEDETYSIGVSIGLVVINPQKYTLTNIMGFADEACYAAKEAGKNRVQVHGEAALDSH